tara:strand:+ start:6474 stop:6731 length:258 start_codon:yes stop_codon:yes gene_type:complete
MTKMNKDILNKLPNTFKDKVKSLGARKGTIMISTLVKEYRLLWNTLSWEGQQLYASDPSTPINKFNRADQAAIRHFEEKMQPWLE